MKALRRYLDSTDMSQLELARRLGGVTQPAVSAWLTGLSIPSIQNLIKISKLTGLSIDELVDNVPVPRRRAQ